VVVKDVMPSGFKRPPLPPRSVVVTVLPYSGKLSPAGYGVNTWTELDDVLGLLQKMADSESAAFALASINLTKDPAARAEAMRRLSDRKDPKALAFITSVFNNLANDADVRGEAALALGLLGDKSSVPVLMPGVTDAAEKTRIASSRALSFYKEEDTRESLMKLLERLDTIRRDAVIASIVSAGWKPVSTLVTMAESPDPLVSRNAIGILGSTRDPRATDLLLKLLRDPGQRDVKAIISALGDTRDPRAVEPLFAVAKDRSKRTGKEVELGEALAELGDQRSADVIVDMIKHIETRTGRMHLLQAYKKLTGKDYNK
jgi:HEAT repeat protein